MRIKMKLTRWNSVDIEHNSYIFSRRYCRFGKLIRTYVIDFEINNPANQFEKFIRRNKPLSTRRILSFIHWEIKTQFVRNSFNLSTHPTYVNRFCGMRHYGKELVDLIDKRMKSFPHQTDYPLANKLKLTVEKTFNL